MLCSALLLSSACQEKRIVTALQIPAERTDCEAATGQRPTLSPEYRIDWTKVASVGQAKLEHEKFVMVIRGRENTVANYVLDLEGRIFQCANDAAWVREWQEGTK